MFDCTLTEGRGDGTFWGPSKSNVQQEPSRPKSRGSQRPMRFSREDWLLLTAMKPMFRYSEAARMNCSGMLLYQKAGGNNLEATQAGRKVLGHCCVVSWCTGLHRSVLGSSCHCHCQSKGTAQDKIRGGDGRAEQVGD